MSRSEKIENKSIRPDIIDAKIPGLNSDPMEK